MLLLAVALPRAQAQRLSAHHSFPLAGDELVLVVEGFGAGAPVQIDLEQALAAPPSIQQGLESAFPVTLDAATGRLTAIARADAQGAVVLRFALDDPDDPGLLVALSFHDMLSEAALELGLFVQPPTLLVPTLDGLARVELLGGRRLLPDVPSTAPLLGAAYSADGLTLSTLSAGGLLEERSTAAYTAPPLRSLAMDPSGERLARSPGGPAFVIARAGGSPFAPPGRLLSLRDGVGELTIDPLGREVAGRRWAVTGDGLTAFVAEDDLIVREIDLDGWRVRTPFTVGFNGDRVVADMALDQSRLSVLSRRWSGQPGSLTTLELGSGLVRPWALSVDPARLLVLDDQSSLVLPAEGAVFQLLEQGAPSSLVAAGAAGERLLDAAVVPDGVLLLIAGADGRRRLSAWSPQRGLSTLALSAPVPQATRLVSAGHDLAVLLGAPDGAVYRVIPSRGVLEPVERLASLPESTPHLLP
ncbi:MAG: hypothetical protein DRQ55_06060 [Planctomycetota bacterium]|nr:MAG: hypothetical protein DRQ55_06060 [Planctomycetota bacterium]